MIVQVQVVRRGKVIFAVGCDSPILREYRNLVFTATQECGPGDAIRTVSEDSPFYDRLGGRVDHR